MATTFAVVTGGGTAGHVLPALAVAEALVANGHAPTEIHYVGAQRGVETRLVAASPFDHTFLDVVGFQRRVTWRNAGFLPKMLRSGRAAKRLLSQLQPKVVVSVGGYASMPSVLAARRLRIPVVVVSYDRRPGRASRLAARRAAACAVAFADSPLPRATVTGAPVRRAILDVDRSAPGRAAARDALGLAHDRFVVAVMGGSLGSGVLNGAIAGYVAAHRHDAALAVRHIAGDRFAATVEPVVADGIVYDVLGYDDRMPEVYAAADLLVGRGGASTVAEVAVTGVPAILVPWAGSAEGHQLANVSWLADQGAAVLLTEDRLGDLGAEIERLRGDHAACEELSRRALDAGQIHRSGALAALIEGVALA